MVFDCTPLRLDLKKRGVSLDQFLQSRKFRYIWISGDTSEDVRQFIKTHSYKMVHSYSFTERPTTFYYQIYEV